MLQISKLFTIVFLLILGCSAPQTIISPSDYLTFEKRIGIGKRHLFVGKYLWVFTGKNRVKIYEGNTYRELLFKDLPIFPCPKPPTKLDNPSEEAIDEALKKSYVYNRQCRPFFNRMFTKVSFGSLMVGIRVQGDKVALELDRKTYTFNADGSLISYTKNHFINDGPPGDWGWEVTNDELSYKGKKKQADEFAFSGPWVATYSKGKRELTLLDAKTGEEKASFPIKNNRTREYQLSKKKGFRLYQSQGGFYIEQDSKPYRWFGEKVIDLQSKGDDMFCYVVDEKKKCIENKGRDLKRIWENKYYLLVWGKWADTYVYPK